MPLPLRLFGTLDTPALQAAMQDLLARHESLRTVFMDTDGVAAQRILTVEAASFALKTVEVTTDTLPQKLAQATVHCFDLSHEIPLRAWLFRLNAQEHVLLLLLHHIASDGWSTAQLTRDLGHAYTARLQGQAPGWAPLPVQYADYTLWQQELFGREDDPNSLISRQFAYWERTLAGLPERLELPANRLRPAIASHQGAYLPLHICPTLHTQLQALAREHRASLFMVLQAALAALLTRLGAGTDIPLGGVIAGRTDEAMNDLVDFFVNTLVLRTDTSNNPSFNELLKQVRETCLAAYAHQDAPFERLVERLNPVRSAAHHPLFQVSLVLQNAAVQSFDLPGLRLVPEPVDTHSAKFDLFFNLEEVSSPDGREQGLEGLIEYATDLFTRGTIEQLAQRFVRLLEAVARDASQPIGQIELLDRAERQQLLIDWNHTECNYPAHLCIHQLFEEQVERTPHATALVYEDQALSYAELNARANRLAHQLIEFGVQPDTLVAICVERSPAMVVGLLAILKAGGAYVPLDPGERLTHILADATPTILRADAAGRAALGEAALASLIVLDPNRLPQSPITNPQVPGLKPHHLAYVIYTSGSTGTPKGVMVEHAQIVRLFDATAAWYHFSQHDTWCLFHSFAFDFSVWELWGLALWGQTCPCAPSHYSLAARILPVALRTRRHGFESNAQCL